MCYLVMVTVSRDLKGKPFKNEREERDWTCVDLFWCSALEGTHSPLECRPGKELCNLPAIELHHLSDPDKSPLQPAAFRVLSVQTSTSTSPDGMGWMVLPTRKG
jgi:hypothetical protein